MCGAGISVNAGIPDFRSPSAGKEIICWEKTTRKPRKTNLVQDCTSSWGNTTYPILKLFLTGTISDRWNVWLLELLKVLLSNCQQWKLLCFECFTSQDPRPFYGLIRFYNLYSKGWLIWPIIQGNLSWDSLPHDNTQVLQSSPPEGFPEEDLHTEHWRPRSARRHSPRKDNRWAASHFYRYLMLMGMLWCFLVQ